MSATDYRKLIDIHGGHFIGVEVTDGRSVEMSIDGEAIKLTIERLGVLDTLLITKMGDLLADGFKTFDFGWRGVTVSLNYYDAGVVLDAVRGAVNYLR